MSATLLNLMDNSENVSYNVDKYENRSWFQWKTDVQFFGYCRGRRQNMDVGTLFDRFEHIGVYIVDRETMNTYYENPIAQRYSGKDRIGKPCYSIHGNLGMCSSCPIRKADHVSLVNRTDLNMVFAVRCEETDWQGHPAYLITVVKQESLADNSDDEKSMNRMSRALQKSVAVYTEINMETMRYRQINLRGDICYNIEAEGDYALACEHMCLDEIHPDDVEEVRRTMAPEVLQRIAADSEGADEVAVRYRLKNVTPVRFMESRAIFMRDELPHYVVSITRDVTEETQLREQASTLESILNHVSCGVAIYDMDEDGKVTTEYVNDGLCNMTECSKEILLREAKKDSMWTVNKNCKEDVAAAFKQIHQGSKSDSVIYHATTYAGKHPWVMLKLAASATEEGKIRIYGTFTDMTAEIETRHEFRDKYEVERRRSQDDSSILAYAVFNIRTGSTIEMERRKPLNELDASMTLKQFCEDIAGTIMSAEKQREFRQMFDPAELMKRHRKGVDEQSIEYQRMLPTGKIIWVKSSFHLIVDSTKADASLFYYCNDINISKSLELMTTYMVNEDYDMMGCINLADDSAIMLYGSNSSRRLHGMHGVHRQEQYSKSLDWFVNHAIVPEEREHYRANAFVDEIKMHLAEHGSYEFVLHVADDQGKIRAKKIRYTRYDAELDVCFFSQTDITDMVAQEEEKQERLQQALRDARQANEAKTAFLSRMSHDMRTPMNGVLGLAELMRDETNLDEIAKDLDQLEMSGRYLLQLINDTLDVSKIESGKMELRLKPVDLKALLGNILNNAGQLAREKGVELTMNRKTSPEEEVSVLADAARLEQIIMNILSNAIKFTPAGGHVDVSIETISMDGSRIVRRYIIKDTGIGISEEFLPHIYESFAQEGRMNTNRENGTGLGMSIVKQLSELMGGTISIQSKINEGTEVRLEIPYEISTVSAGDDAGTSMDLSVLRGKRALLCEDHPLNAQIAIRLLEKQGVIVDRVENGKLGVEQFEKSVPGTYDVILMDIRMPVMNGLEAARAIRGLAGSESDTGAMWPGTAVRSDAATIPILAMTANAFDDDVQDCMAAGMNGHISKPVDPMKLYSVIAEVV